MTTKPGKDTTSAMDIELKKLEVALAQAQLELSNVQLDAATGQKGQRGIRSLLSPTGVVLVAAAFGLLGTALGKYGDYVITKRSQETSVILKASDVPVTLSPEEQKTQRARNLLWFAEGHYIELPENFTEQLRTIANLRPNQPTPAPVIQASAAVSTAAPHYNFRILNGAAVNPRGWDIDVFACTEDGPLMAAAENFANRLAALADAGTPLGESRLGRIRFDAGTEHQQPGNRIYYDPPELNVARALQAELGRDPRIAFSLAPNNDTLTQSYLSIYFCAG